MKAIVLTHALKDSLIMLIHGLAMIVALDVMHVKMLRFAMNAMTIIN